MEKNQKINCSVGSCIYNNQETQECKLESINVTPVQNCKSEKPDESQCSSYKHQAY